MSDNSQTLELEIKSTAEQAKSSVDKLVKSITGVENVLTNIYLELGSIEKKSETSMSKTTQQVDNLKSKTDKATNSMNKLGTALSFGGTYLGAKKLTNQFLDWMDLSIDYTEQLNLFNVVFKNVEKDGVQTFSTLGQEALKFQNKLNEAFGTNKTETLYMQGIFQSMGETVGIEDKYSAIMSETMTKLTYDLASLYNKSEQDTAEAIRAGVYAGQSKPLRSFGIDVTQQSLQPILESLGITDRSVKQMSQAEKEILRYIAALNQAKIAMGDMANTIESPSNQLKVFKQQLAEAKVALTGLFIGTFSKILPYANAILMVVKEISKAIATMFGIKLTDFNSGIATQEGIYDGIADSADGASKAVKELKRQTLGFDEIHNINEDKDSGTSGVSGGIDQRLLDAISGYDNGMDKIKMKATEIRDKLMEWLGFHKEYNDELGEWQWKLNDGYTRIEKIRDLMILAGATFAGWKISKSMAEFMSWYSTNGKYLKKAMGITMLISGLVFTNDTVSKMLDGDTSLGTALQGIISGLSVGVGTYMVTKSITVTLLVTAIALVTEATISIKNLWEEIEPDIEKNGGLWETWKQGVGIIVDDVKSKFSEFKDNIKEKIDEIGIELTGNEDNWNLWKKELGIGWDLLTHNFGDLTQNFKQDFDDLKEEIDKNGGYWQSWKDGMSLIWDKAKTKFSETWNKSSLGQLNQAIEENGGYWQSWKQGIGLIMDELGISKFFTKDYWVGKFKGIVEGGREIIDKLKEIFENFTANLKTPHITWDQDGWQATGKIKDVMEFLHLPTTMPKMNIKWYANGGLPSVGEMFVAREAGPELVGKIGNHNAVMNNNQIVDSVKAGVYEAVISAMSQIGGQSSQIDVHVHTDEGTVIDKIEQRTKQTGVFPFTIPAL